MRNPLEVLQEYRQKVTTEKGLELMNVNAVFERALLAYVRETVDERATGITSWASEKRADGYCETCYYEYQVVAVNYSRDGMEDGHWEWHGDMGELIRRLDAADVVNS